MPRALRISATRPTRRNVVWAVVGPLAVDHRVFYRGVSSLVMKLIALKKMGPTLPGQIFEVRDSDARALILLKVAKPFEAEETASLSAVEEPVRVRRRYQRRDLTAVD